MVKHRGSGGLYRTDEDVARHRDSLIGYRRSGKPVVHNEFFLSANRSTADPNFVRKMFWADFTGGGHANFYDFSSWRGTGASLAEGTASRPPLDTILNAGLFLRRFIEEGDVPFWQMAPHDELARTLRAGRIAPFVLAQPSAVCVVYLVSGGGVAVDLRSEPAPRRARWFNPRDGRFGETFHVQGGDWREFQAPDGHDWALLLEG